MKRAEVEDVGCGASKGKSEGNEEITIEFK